MKHRLQLLTFALAFTLGFAACSDDTEPTDVDSGVVTTDAADKSDASDASQPDAPSPDVGLDVAPDVTGDGIPDEITTSGASFGGTIPASGEIELTLVANEGDWVVLWLRVDGEPSWNPSVSIFRDTNKLVFGNPQGDADAHIPYQASELDKGWEFYDGGRYRLLLENFADVDGHFEFSIECISGPCTDATDTDGDGIVDSIDNCVSEPNLDQVDGDGDGVGDACDPDFENNAYDGLSNTQLEDAMRAEHQGHKIFSYDRARDYIFGRIDNVDGWVECVYTGEKISTSDRTDAFNQGFNTEHTWPQSRGASELPEESDMHHLFPATATSNQFRSNNFFGDVIGNVSWSTGDSKLGEDDEGATRFEPRDAHKGNVARAIFYFAVIYRDSADYHVDPENNIPAHEEDTLRQWHVADPVDAAEQARNQAVADLQKSRNPFVDQPDLVDRIADF
jgi:endonuclease I